MCMEKYYLNRIDRLELAFVRDGVFEKSLLSKSDDALIVPSFNAATSWDEPDKYVYKPDETDIVPEPPDWLPPIDNSHIEDWLRSPFEDNEEEVSKGFRIGDWWIIRDLTPFANSPYKHNYRVIKLEGYVPLGYIYFQTYLLNRDNIYLRISNQTLYSENLWTLIQKFITDFSLQMRYVSKLDIAIDSHIDIGSGIYDAMKNDHSITWLVNGRKILNRDETIKELFWVMSGSLNDPSKNKAMYIKQQQGPSQVSYNKTIEISDSNAKMYQIKKEDGLWSHNDYIYRNEIRLDRMCIIKYIERAKINDMQLFRLIRDENYRDELYKDITQRMIRWWKDGKLKTILDLVTEPEKESTSSQSLHLSASFVNDIASSKK